MVDIKIASTDNIPQIQSVASNTWWATYRDILSPEQLDYMYDMMYSTESLTEQMTVDMHTFYIAYFDGQPCGYVSMVKELDNHFHLQKIYVDPEFQGKGIGRKLIERAFQHAKENTPLNEECVVELNVNRKNHSLHFYEKMGMKIDRQGDFPIGNGFFMCDYIMRISL